MSKMPEALIKNIIEKVGTPFYLYDAGMIRENIRRVKAAFPETVIHYSLKANPCPGLCRIISESGIEAEIASPFEARTAVETWFNPAEILYDGPAKTNENIIENLNLGLKRFNIESMTELARLKEVSGGKTEDLTLCFRVNPMQESTAAEKMTGKPSRFGIDIEELPACLDKAADDGFKIKGIHLYIGSQILSNEQLIANYWTGLEIIKTYYDKFFTEENIEYIFGAGFGIPYKDDDPVIDLDSLAQAFRKLRSEYAFGAKITPRFELGRYIIGNTGRYFAKIIDIKVSRGEKFITIDGGANHFMRYVMAQARHRVSTLKPSAAELESAEICGRTCTPYDIIAEADLPKDIAIGDIIVLEDAGAYGWSMGIQNFLSFPSCAEVIMDGDDFKVVRRAGTFTDLMNLNS